jgi:hypothetical protein
VAPRYPSTAFPNHTGFGSGSIASQPRTELPVSTVAGYDSTSKAVENDLTLALRGMAVEDSYNGAQQNAQQSISGIPALQHQVHQPRTGYHAYGQADYSAYYNNPPARESYVDYPYGYDAYRTSSDPTLYPSSVTLAASPSSVYPGVSSLTLHPNAQQPGVFYDYHGAAHPPSSQFYYPAHQAVMYPPAHSPLPTSQLSNPATLAEKKRELQVRSIAYLLH